MHLLTYTPKRHIPWNKGKLVGQKQPLKLKEIWSIHIHLQIANRIRDLALFNMAIDSKLRSCDLVKLRVKDVARGGSLAKRAMVMQQKTRQPVQFEITEQTREAVADWIAYARLTSEDYCLKADSRARPTFQPGNMPELRNPGSLRLALIRLLVEPTL